MKEYMKPSIEVLKVESDQLLEVSIVNEDAEVVDGFYRDSRLDIFDVN